MNKVIIEKTFKARDKNCLNFKKLRLSLGLSQSRLSALLDLQPQTISQYECGTRRPSVGACRRFIKLAQETGFNITLDYLRPEI